MRKKSLISRKISHLTLALLIYDKGKFINEGYQFHIYFSTSIIMSVILDSYYLFVPKHKKLMIKFKKHCLFDFERKNYLINWCYGCSHPFKVEGNSRKNAWKWRCAIGHCKRGYAYLNMFLRSIFV